MRKVYKTRVSRLLEGCICETDLALVFLFLILILDEGIARELLEVIKERQIIYTNALA